jgi:enterochelin esterase-like enzyme
MWRATLLYMIRQVALASLLFCATAFAQTSVSAPQPAATKPLHTHEVNADGTITFRYPAAGAMKVSLSTDAIPKPLPMVRDAEGVWSVTTPVLPPEIYSYSFTADGRHTIDPFNTALVPNLLSVANNVTVPSEPPAPWELTAIAHGSVDRHVYTTKVAKNLPASQEPYMVYTPPGYDAKRKGGYPVLYLLHGWSDDETGWTAVGRANLILDSLIDSGKAVPMIVVMPLGYGDYDFVTHGFSAWNDEAKVNENVALFSQMLLTEIIPAVEGEYDVAAGRDNHAITGLSMGGLESLTIGLKHSDEFAWVGGMSSALFHKGFDEQLPNLDPKVANLRLLWVACGKTDQLITPVREFIVWARAKGFAVAAVETSGAHTWLTWRDNLITLSPLLFQK